MCAIKICGLTVPNDKKLVSVKADELRVGEQGEALEELPEKIHVSAHFILWTSFSFCQRAELTENSNSWRWIFEQ